MPDLSNLRHLATMQARYAYQTGNPDNSSNQRLAADYQRQVDEEKVSLMRRGATAREVESTINAARKAAVDAVAAEITQERELRYGRGPILTGPDRPRPKTMSNQRTDEGFRNSSISMALDDSDLPAPTPRPPIASKPVEAAHSGKSSNTRIGDLNSIKPLIETAHQTQPIGSIQPHATPPGSGQGKPGDIRSRVTPPAAPLPLPLPPSATPNPGGAKPRGGRF